MTAAGGGGIGDATVELSDGTEDGLRTTTTATSPAGVYVFTDVAPGTYTLRFTSPVAGRSSPSSRSPPAMRSTGPSSSNREAADRARRELATIDRCQPRRAGHVHRDHHERVDDDRRLPVAGLRDRSRVGDRRASAPLAVPARRRERDGHDRASDRLSGGTPHAGDQRAVGERSRRVRARPGAAVGAAAQHGGGGDRPGRGDGGQDGGVRGGRHQRGQRPNPCQSDRHRSRRTRPSSCSNRPWSSSRPAGPRWSASALSGGRAWFGQPRARGFKLGVETDRRVEAVATFIQRPRIASLDAVVARPAARRRRLRRGAQPHVQHGGRPGGRRQRNPIALTSTGYVKMHDPAKPAGNKTTVISIPTRADHGNSEDGVLGMSLQPGFDLADPNKRDIFVYYSPRNPEWPSTGNAQVVGYNQISRWTLTADGTAAEPDSERVILRVPKAKIAGTPSGFPAARPTTAPATWAAPAWTSTPPATSTSASATTSRRRPGPQQLPADGLPLGRALGRAQDVPEQRRPARQGRPHHAVAGHHPG